MALLNNGNPEEFVLFFRNFNMTLTVSGTLEMAAKVKYLRMIVCEEEIYQFDLLSDDVESTNPLMVEAIILGFGAYFFPVNFLSKKKRVMRRGMRKPRGLKLRR